MIRLDVLSLSVLALVLIAGCRRGVRCDPDGRCPEHFSCDRTRVYSSETAVMVPPRCRDAGGN